MAKYYYKIINENDRLCDYLDELYYHQDCVYLDSIKVVDNDGVRYAVFYRSEREIA